MTKDIVWLIVFLFGLLMFAKERIRFERKSAGLTMDYETLRTEYRRLYREVNNIYLVIFIVLVIERIIRLLDI